MYDEQIVTPQQAADILRVSHPSVINPLEGEIPYHRIDGHRRIRFNGVYWHTRKNESEEGDMQVNLIVPDANELDSIKNVVRSLKSGFGENKFVIVDQANNIKIELPRVLYRVLLDVSLELAKDNAVGVAYYEQDQAAQDED